MDNGKTIPKQDVQRYLDLSKRLRSTYFKKSNEESDKK
jgi:hypothetical protein